MSFDSSVPNSAHILSYFLDPVSAIFKLSCIWAWKYGTESSRVTQYVIDITFFVDGLVELYLTVLEHTTSVIVSSGHAAGGTSPYCALTVENSANRVRFLNIFINFKYYNV